MRIKSGQIFIILLLFCCSCTATFHVARGKEAFDKYNYFDAKIHFEKAAEDPNFKANYYLALLHYNNDNPFHNLNRAYQYAVKCDSLFRKLHFSEIDSAELDSSAWRSSIDAIKQEISTAVYVHVGIIDQIKRYQRFIDRHPWAEEVTTARKRRNQLALKKAYDTGTARAFQDFINRYPESRYIDEAQRQYEKNLYQEQTKSQTLLSYKNFIKKYPESPYRKEAEKAIYDIETEYSNINAFESFIKSYPDNHLVAKAWHKVFSLYMKNGYSLKKLKSFDQAYPNYPFKEELEETFTLASTLLLPFEINSKWGYMDTTGSQKITPKFDWVENFNEGLALAGKNDTIGYIDKTGHWKITNIDDGTPIKGGVAVVEKNGLFGVVDRSGKYIYKTKFEDIGQYAEGLFYVLKDKKYGYSNNSGVMVITRRFDYAEAFQGGHAKVQIDDLWGLIDRNGSFLIRPKYKRLIYFNDSAYIAEQNGKQGVLTLKKDTLIPFVYSKIEPEREGMALVVQDNKVGYYNLAKNKRSIDCQFEPYPTMATLGAFRQNHAAVKVKGKLGFIDKTGERNIPAIFKVVGYYDERIPIMKEEKWGFCDRKADLKIDYQFTQAQNFVGGNAVVQKDPFYAVIDKEGNNLLPMEYEKIERIDSITFLVKKKGRWGVRTIKEQIVPLSYSKFVVVTDRYIRFEMSGTFIYYDIKTSKIIQL